VLDDLLSPEAARLYARLVSLPSLTLHDRSVDTPDPAAVHELVEHGFARLEPGSPPALVPVAPAVAAGPTLARAAERLLARQDVVAAAYAEVSKLQQVYADTSGAAGLADQVAIVAGHERLRALARRLIASPVTELLHTNTAHQRREPTVADLVPPPADRMAQGLQVRCVYAAAYLRHAEAEEIMRRSQQFGEQIRVSAEVPLQLIVIDRRVAYVPLLLPHVDAALLVRAPALVDALCGIFELLWQRATPWREPGRSDDPLTPTQRRVLELLAAGFTDAQVADQLRVSIRTVRRHVLAVLDRLGAPTRFAAGVIARQRGWL
jgi:DNA-binding CsgD family transcriptional regulator